MSDSPSCHTLGENSLLPLSLLPPDSQLLPNRHLRPNGQFPANSHNES